MIGAILGARRAQVVAVAKPPGRIRTIFEISGLVPEDSVAPITSLVTWSDVVAIGREDDDANHAASAQGVIRAFQKTVVRQVFSTAAACGTCRSSGSRCDR